MSIPILTYHSQNISRNTYAGNDHLALASDLENIYSLGFRVVPLSHVVDWHQGILCEKDILNTVAITFDDGSWFDYFDLDHPTCGPQRSMFNILRDFKSRIGLSEQLHSTCFVICSPDVRSLLDKRCMVGKDWWGDQWWKDALDSGFLGIECHSWDHVHPSLDFVAQKNQIKGDFSQVKSFLDSDVQFTIAAEYIEQKLGGIRPSFFAYPYGEYSNYVINDFLPKFKTRHRFKSAFSTEPKAVSRSDNIWALPRFVCGRDWRSPDQFRDLILSI